MLILKKRTFILSVLLVFFILKLSTGHDSSGKEQASNEKVIHTETSSSPLETPPPKRNPASEAHNKPNEREADLTAPENSEHCLISKEYTKDILSYEKVYCMTEPEYCLPFEKYNEIINLNFELLLLEEPDTDLDILEKEALGDRLCWTEFENCLAYDLFPNVALKKLDDETPATCQKVIEDEADQMLNYYKKSLEIQNNKISY